MLSEKPWSRDAVIQLFLEIFATLCVGALVGAGVERLELPFLPVDKKTLSLIVFTISFQGAALLWILSFLRNHGLTWREAFGFRESPWVAAGLGLMAAIFVLPIAWALQQLSAYVMTSVHVEPTAQPAVEKLQSGVPLGQQIYLGIIAVIVAPLVEEILFRGILYPTIKQAGRPRLALWITSVFFALTHVNTVTFVPLLFLAVVLALIYEHTGNLIAPMIAHSSFNAANLLLIIFPGPLNRLLGP
jgi:membrane protease YdiL (CAAX protease family)